MQDELKGVTKFSRVYGKGSGTGPGRANCKVYGGVWDGGVNKRHTKQIQSTSTCTLSPTSCGASGKGRKPCGESFSSQGA
jgi:hypothetical protein